jgi:hypothetical protein
MNATAETLHARWSDGGLIAGIAFGFANGGEGR